MANWASGYVADIEYLPGLYVEQTPAHLTLACLLNGIEPPDIGGAFTYCELGCGQGVTASIIAAANPKAHVVAADFNPAHIARARQVAREAHLTNIEFLELSFEEMLEKHDLPDFDMVTMHGVWSWIGAAERAQITEFLKQKVTPGGLVSITYNAMPGWAVMLPIQRLLYEHAGLGHDRSDEAIMKGLDWIEELQKCGSGVLGNAELIDQIRNGTSSKAAGSHRAVYLAHEYINGGWQPQYHMDTAKQLAPAKLNYVGASGLLDAFPDLSFRPEQKQALEQVPRGPLRETLKDYLVNRPFRRDVYVRGARQLSDRMRDAKLQQLALALTVPPDETRLSLDVPAGKAELPKHHYEPIFDALAQRPHTLKELASLPALAGLAGAPSLVEIAGILVGSGQAQIAPWGMGAGSNAGAAALNRAATREVAEQRSSFASIAAPLTGSGLTLQTMEALVFDAIATGTPRAPDAVISKVADRVRSGGVPLQKDGKAIDAPDAQLAVVAESVEWCFTRRLPLWDQLHVF
ncbi:class I SAM-dependent methyltransferase [Aquabacter sp. CN5-332]|uniref:class I SAM-dependent methyltransferase n=1 Tax=Aquabacter sp. CN5-332 TaxID=3156608 RepID=UPI0032B34252